MAISKTLGISFPFRKGSTEFPQSSSGAQSILDNVKSLLSIGSGEIPMGNEIGTRIHEFVFGPLSPITSARIAQSVRAVVSANEPRMQILSVNTKERTIVGGGTAIDVVVNWQVGASTGDLTVQAGKAD